MFEAYKVGVTLSLQNQVSSVLGLIARDFIKVDKEAKKLQATLKEIKLLGMGGAIIGGAGFLGLGMIGKVVKPAEDYVAQLNRMNLAGMQQADIARSVGIAWKNTSDVLTTTATGSLKTILDLRQVLGANKSLDEVERLLPVISKIQAVMAASSNSRLSKHGDEIAFGMAKALDIIGAVSNPNRMLKEAGMMSKVIAATQGRVTPQMYQSVFQYARQGKFDLSDEFKYEILPSLMLEAATKNGGGGGSRGVGPAIAAAYRFTNQGYINKKSLPLLQSLGLVSANTALNTTTSGTTVGPMKDAGLAASNFFLWVNQDLVPAIISKYGNNPSVVRQKINEAMRGNQLASSLAVEFYSKSGNFRRDQMINRSALSYDQAYISALSKNPKTAWDALSAQWENLKTAMGIPVVSVILPALHGLTTAFNVMGRFFQAHPGIAGAVAITFGGLSALAATAGTLMIASAGIKLLSLGIGPIATAMGSIGALPLMGIAGGLTALSIALAALIPVVFHKEIAGWIDKHAPGIGDALLSAKNSLGGGYGYAPHGVKTPTQIHTQVNLDGHQIAKVVTKHQAKAMNSPMSGTSGFDGRMSYVPSGATGAW